MPANSRWDLIRRLRVKVDYYRGDKGKSSRETSVHIYQTTRRHIPENTNLYSDSRAIEKNLSDCFFFPPFIYFFSYFFSCFLFLMFSFYSFVSFRVYYIICLFPSSFVFLFRHSISLSFPPSTSVYMLVTSVIYLHTRTVLYVDFL